MTGTGAAIEVTWLGHSTAVLDVSGPAPARLLTDPLLQRHAGLLRRRGDRPGDVWQGADAVLLSHLHYDHAEVRSLRLLPGTPILTAPANARWLRRHGLRGIGLGGTWLPVGGHMAALDGVFVRLVRAVHGDRPMPYRPNAANGHLVRVRSGDATLTVWVVGDTEPFPGMVHLPQIAGSPIDLALIPVGGWGPKLSGGHLDPVQAARVCAQVGVRAAIPVHWGTLHAPGGENLPRGWMDYAGAAFEAAAAREAPTTAVVVLQPGQSWQMDG